MQLSTPAIRWIHKGKAQNVNTEHINGIQVCRFDGRIDSSNADQTTKDLRDAVAEESGHVVFDFGNVDYVSSAGIRVILIVLKELTAQERRLAIGALNPDVRDVFHITGLEKLVPCHDTLDAALSAVAP